MNNMPSPTPSSDSANAHEPSSLPFRVVGIGASAGGVQALLRFFENAPADMDMAFVVVLHLSPKHVSSADQILQSATRMRVMQVSDPVPIQKNHVYVIAPAKNLVMTDGYLRVTEREPTSGGPVTIDRFFRTLADAHGTQAIGVVLSGTGSDGAVGLSRIKELGGITLAQEPGDAEYPEMPESAIGTTQIDIVLPVVDMPQKLLELRDNAQKIQLPNMEPSEPLASALKPSGSDAEKALIDILTNLRLRTGHDFRYYKRATVLRRIERRLQVNALPDLPAYLAFLRHTPAETSALLADMLIGVTNFFRDRESFETLERDVIPALFRENSDESPIRAWVAGCSTGEEAYSLTMLLVQQQEIAHSSASIQVFASDIDEAAIVKARSGSYPTSIVSDLSPAMLRQFFNPEGTHYRIVKQIREKILFAPHSILRDPPFSQVNLISCRNVLIYLDRSVQRQVFELFHFALRPNGYLFLGSAESADLADDLFSVVDKKHRIFRAKVGVNRTKSGLGIPRHHVENRSVELERLPEAITGPLPRSAERQTFSFAALHQRVLEQYAPPSVIVDRDSKVVHLSNNAGRFLHHAGGELSSSIVGVVLPELRLDLRTTLFKTLQTGASVEARRVQLVRDGRPSWVNMTMRPFHDADANADFVLILFDEVQERMSEEGEPVPGDHVNPVMAQLEEELQRSREHLADTIEQYETSLEELKASNEELQAINEELRSATEELESSKEELQSVNEELTTVNGELQGRIEETAKANDDLLNIIAATDIATLFVDTQMRIKRFTPSATSVFNLIETDVGRSLFHITHGLRYPTLAEDVAQTFQTLNTIEREVQHADGRFFLSRVLPYRTTDHRIDGAVLTLIDVTARHKAEQAAMTGEERLRLAAQTTNDFAIIVQESDGTIASWNAGATKVFGYAPEEVIGRNIELIFSQEDKQDGVPVREREIASREGHADDERWHVAKDGRRLYCSGVVTPVADPKFTGFAKIARDQTDRKTADDANREALAKAHATSAEEAIANRLKDDFIAVLSHELKHPLNLINVKAEMLPRIPEARGVASIQAAADAIRRSVRSQAQIIDDLLDLSRLRTGKLALEVAQVDVAGLLSVIRDASEADAHASGVTLTIRGISEPAFALVDAVRCDQILWNLVSNALKFTQTGGTIDIQLKREEAMLRIDVVDTGEGINQSFLPYVFEMFRQQPGPRMRKKGGLGIGLALVKQLVEMHGGRIAAHSDGAGTGTRMTVWLPAVVATGVTSVSPATAASTVSGVRVLIVDDDPETRASFAELLEMEGAVVATASGAHDALTVLENQSFDVLLSDVEMPDMDGYEFIRRVRENPGLTAMKAIAATGHDRDEDKRKALDAGFDAQLGKPVSFDALILEMRGRRRSDTAGS